MQEKFGGNFDEKVLKWTEETKAKELMIRFLEEAKQRVQLLEEESLTECLINFSCVEELKEFQHFDEATHRNCLKMLKDIREKECSLSAGPISRSAAQCFKKQLITFAEASVISSKYKLELIYSCLHVFSDRHCPKSMFQCFGFLFVCLFFVFAVKNVLLEKN